MRAGQRRASRRDARLLDVAADDVDGAGRGRARDDGRRPRRRRARGAAGRRARRRAARPRACRCFGPARGGRAARGLQGVRQGDHGRRPACRPPRTRSCTTVEDGHGGDRRATRSVIKADGLAAGKGVVIAAGRGARRAPRSRRCSSSAASATEPVVVEEFLDGRGALAARAVRRRARACRWRPAQDYKRIGDGDTGPNTGGMGCLLARPGDRRRAASTRSSATVHQPVVDELARARHAVPRRPLRRAHAHRRRARRCSSSTCASATRRRRPCCRGCAATCSTLLLARDASRAGSRASSSSGTGARRSRVVLASRGYPASSSQRRRRSPGSTTCPAGVEVTHAGTRASATATIVTAGGRVLNVTALGDGPRCRPRRRVCCRRDDRSSTGRQLRRDIALRAVERVA